MVLTGVSRAYFAHSLGRDTDGGGKQGPFYTLTGTWFWRGVSKAHFTYSLGRDSDSCIPQPHLSLLSLGHTHFWQSGRDPHQLPCTEAGRPSKSVEGPGKSLFPCRKLCPSHAAKLTLTSIPLTSESHRVLVPKEACQEQTQATHFPSW